MAALNATPLPTGKRVIAIDWALPKDQYKEFEKQEMAETADANSNPMDEDDAEKSGNDSDDSDDDGVDVVFDEDDEDEVEEEDAEAKPVAKKESDDVQNGTTIFIRNLAFETTEEDLREK